MRACLGAWLMLAAAALLPGLAAAQQAQEHEVKAAFLFKFPAFVEWPAKPGPEVPFVIAVTGAPRVAEELRLLATGRNLEGRQIQVREIAEGESALGANMVFVGHAASERLAQLARALAGAPVLLVGESPGALEQGAMINFVLSEGRVRFDVALDSADTAKLRISSRLLGVANRVRGPKL